jgi:hypothetical protein
MPVVQTSGCTAYSMKLRIGLQELQVLPDPPPRPPLNIHKPATLPVVTRKGSVMELVWLQAPIAVCQDVDSYPSRLDIFPHLKIGIKFAMRHKKGKLTHMAKLAPILR